MTDMLIRLAEPRDAQEIARIHSESWAFAYSEFLSEDILKKQDSRRSEMWRMILENNSGTYVAEVDGKIIGFIGINPSRDEGLDDACELTGMYLDPKFVGKGAGRALVDFAKHEMTARGYNRMSLWVFEKNIRARKFYEKSDLLPDGAEQTVLGAKAMRYIGLLR